MILYSFPFRCIAKNRQSFNVLVCLEFTNMTFLLPLFMSTAIVTASPSSGVMMSPFLAAYRILYGTGFPFSVCSVSRDSFLKCK